MRHLNTLFMLLLLHCCITVTYAALPVVTTTQDSQSSFDLKQANKQFDQLNLKLSVENVNLDHLDAAITLLDELINGANNCITTTQKKLSTLDSLIQEATHASDTNKSSADLLYLKQEQKKIATQLSQCRLFSIRAQEAINTYQATVNHIRQKQTLTRGLPLWSLITEIQNNPIKTLAVSVPAISIPPILQSPFVIGFCLVVCLLLASLVIIKTKHHPTCRRFMRVKHLSILDGLLLSCCFLGTLLTMYLFFLKTETLQPSSLLVQISETLVYYLWGVAFIRFLFNIKSIAAFFYWYSLDTYFFKNVFIFLFTCYVLSIAGPILMQSITIHPIIWQFCQILFLLAVLIIAVEFFYYFCYAHKHIKFIQKYRKSLQTTAGLVFLACGIINILGYNALAMHLTQAGITTFTIIFSTIIIEHAINKLYFLSTHPSKLHNQLIHLFGYKSDQTFVEFLLLRTTLQIITLASALYLISKNWGYGSGFFESAYTQLIFGIHLGTLTFYPTRIMAGIIVFCVLYLLFRAISTRYSRHEQFEDEEETQVAVASILTYVGFACALIVALFISGIDFTGLAIIAGALSVGIGLGLQSIVNNFVSGIILLIEKPIKPGDRISIDGLEGTVKKIRVRSTQMTTTAREDIIIPNSDLITRPVTNYMFSDTYLSIHCEVGVAYGSDTALVRQLLLDAANEHDEIVKTPRFKPSVLFSAFGDSAMIFQIWFLIKDGNKKATVRSEINFSIERIFREHKIVIAFPQRDINIKMTDISAINTNI